MQTPRSPVPDPTVTALCEHVRDLQQRVRALEDRLTAQLGRVDRARLLVLLPAWGGAFGSSPVTAREVLEHTSAGLRTAAAGLNAKALGKLARRASGVPMGGFVLTRAGSEGGAALWCVREVIS